jgi:hypothetical protein
VVSSTEDEAQHGLHCESESHGLAATNLVREVAANEWAWNVEAVDDDTPAQIGDKRVAGIDAIDDGAGKDTEGLEFDQYNLLYM